MDKGYLVVTNGIIDYLDDKLPEKTAVFLESVVMQLSVISRIELLAWNNITVRQQQVLEGFLAASHILGLSEEIILQTIHIRKLYRVKLPDAIIAATAMANNLTLVTRNVSDFRNVAGLSLMDPWKV